MILDDTLLPKPASWRNEGEVHVFQTTEGPRSVTLKATAVDSIGCRLWEVQATCTNGPANALKELAERIAGRVTGLLEPLRLIEADTDQGVALVRSDVPSTKQEEAFYTELLLRQDGGVELRRYQAARPGQGRQQVAFSLTHEAIVKLVDDLTR